MITINFHCYFIIIFAIKAMINFLVVTQINNFLIIILETLDLQFDPNVMHFHLLWVNKFRCLR